VHTESATAVRGTEAHAENISAPFAHRTRLLLEVCPGSGSMSYRPPSPGTGTDFGHGSSAFASMQGAS
jgi:hypothetical protein